MVIFTTAYTSTMRRPMSDPDLVDLLVTSRARNAERGVTGLLLYRGGRVLEMLEGEESVVRALYDRIRMDTRHDHVSNVWSSTASSRRFPDWTMGFEDLDGVHRSIATGAPLAADVLAGPLPGASSAGSSAADGVVEGESPGLVVPAEQADYLQRRATVLRRVLASGDRLVGALGIILNGHDPEEVAILGCRQLCCRICRTHDAPELDTYPCATVKNALWALEAAGPH